MHYHDRIEEFKSSPLAGNDIVFLGNSITEGGGDWSKRLGWPNTKNRGISGDVADGVLKRLGEINYFKPKAVFLMIGINDLFDNKVTPAYVAGRIQDIVAAIQRESPNTKLYVQTILPTSTISMKQKIQQTNNLLRKSADKEMYSLLDTYQVFAGNDGLIKREYTDDGLHPNEEGYKAWVDFLSKLSP